MVPNSWKQAANFLNRFGLPKAITVDDFSLAISDGSLLASLLSKYYPDEIDISRLTLPASTLHSKMHNWTVVNEALASPLDNQQLLSLASGNDDSDAIEGLLDRLRQMLPDEGKFPSTECNQQADEHASASDSTTAAATKLLLDAINVCEGSVQLLSERTDLLGNVLRELRELHDNINVGNNHFDRLLGARQKECKRLSKSSRPVEGISSLKSSKKKGKPTSENARPKVTFAKSTKPARKTKKQKLVVNSNAKLLATEDRIRSLKQRFDDLLKEQHFLQ